MRFRIRYEKSGRPLTAEVEANSPDEAVVKFRHAKPAHEWRYPGLLRVVSVFPIEAAEEVLW